MDCDYDELLEAQGHFYFIQSNDVYYQGCAGKGSDKEENTIRDYKVADIWRHVINDKAIAQDASETSNRIAYRTICIQ